MYYIYKVTNKINGKIYIGQTVNFERRKRDHIYASKKIKSKGEVFHKAIHKYGEDNFEWEIIDNCKTPEDATMLESKYIIEYNSCISFDKSNGYNVLVSLDNVKRAHNSIKVLAYDLKGIYVGTYLSCEIAAKELNCKSANITKCLRRERKSTGGYQFKRYKDNFPFQIEPYKTNELEAKYKAVYQYDKLFSFVQKHHSLQECADFIGVTRNAITHAMKEGRTCKGYYFSYKPL